MSFVEFHGWGSRISFLVPSFPGPASLVSPFMLQGWLPDQDLAHHVEQLSSRTWWCMNCSSLEPWRPMVKLRVLQSLLPGGWLHQPHWCSDMDLAMSSPWGGASMMIWPSLMVCKWPHVCWTTHRRTLVTVLWRIWSCHGSSNCITSSSNEKLGG